MSLEGGHWGQFSLHKSLLAQEILLVTALSPGEHGQCQYYIEETVIEEGEPHEVVTEITETISTDYSGPETITTTTTYTAEHTQPPGEDAAPPVRKKTIRTKVDPSKFLTPYLEHSNKMKDLFSENKYKEKFRKERGKPYASTIDTPEIRRIKKVQDQLSEVKYRMAGGIARTICHVDEKAMDIEHAKKVSQQVSKVLYKQNWEENKDKYLLPPDAPELVNAIKNTAMFSKKLYTEDWDADKTLFYPYSDSPELRRVAQAQKTLSDIVYKKGHDERKAKFTSLPDPPDVEQAKKVSRQLSDVIYHEDYKNKIKGKWSQTPCYDVAIAKMNAENLSMRKYQEDFENMKDQIYFMQTETPEYEANKRASENVSKFKYRADYEKKKAIADYNVLPATENPLLQQLKTAGNILSDKLYKEAYEQSKGNRMNYCETPKFQTDAALKNFSDVKYKDAYQKNILGHYLGSFEDPHHIHCMKVEAMKSDKNYKADYEEEKTKCYFPQTITQEYEAIKKLEQCKDYTYKKHPDQTKFTSVTDSPVQKQAEINSKQLSDILYKSKGEEIIHKYHLPPDVPQFIQARVNAYNISDANYKADWKKTLSKGYDLKPDAIPIIAAKASRNIASDVKYKESYEKEKGKQVGFRSLQDDPKLVHYMNVAKIQSDREYKKDYEVTKTKYHTPLDMFSVTAAKKAQEVVTNTGYKQPIHNYTLLPDSVNLELSRNVMQLQSDNLYKSDFNNWLRGVGWVPIQSLDVEKAKKATEILSEKKYRQHPDQLKFSIPMDAMEQVLAKQNAKTMNKRLYTDKWNKEKTSIHVMPDTPEILQCKVNQMTMSDKLYRAGWEEEKKKGYDLQPDAIPIKAAKSSRDIASDYKYKLAYEKAKGKHIGFRSLEDDPKLVHFMQVAKMQSDREYKKGYETAKTNFHTPVDMVSVVAAKKAQEVATNANYKNLIHTYNVLPDAMSIELAKNMMQLQSDNQYKAEYDETMKGVGWIPLGSLEAEKNKKAMEIVSEKKYRQHPDKLKYSVPMDSMNVVLALNNAKIMDEHKYKQAWEEDKKKIHITPDIPQIVLAKVNAFNLSDKMYRSSFEETRKKGYDLRADAIPVKAAKASRDIASDYKYKLGYEQDKGKLVGFRSLQDDPKLVHCMQVAKMQSDREYKKAYENSKTHYQTPSDALSVVAAKEAQDRVTNTNYKRLIHQYMLLPDAMSLELYRNMNQIQSDNEYKQDYKEWFRGIGWSPIGSLDVEKSKKATEIASDRKYRQHPSLFPFTKQNDAMDLVLAKQNANIMNKHAYTQAWEKDKTQVHVMPDTPDILQAKQNKTNYSQKLYKLGWEEMIKKGYDLTPEAMSVKAAKASRDIASDFKYKEGYRKQQGHHIGFRSLQDDPKMLWSMQVAKMQSEREYKKDFEKWKTKFNMPVDMLGFLLAKKCQELVSDVDYKHILHRWTCLPDQVDVIEAKRVNELQSDNVYKSDLQWLRGIGWSPLGSLEAEKNKKASEILNEKKYRQHPDTIKFTSIPDAMDVVLAKSNAKNRSDILYKEAWNKDKTKVHIMPDTPEILLAKSNLINASDKRYKVGFEELKKKGYDLPPDAIPLQAAKASRDIASEYKYKTAYRKQLGHHIGARNIEDDPKMMWSMHVAKIQSDREYKKDFEKSKTRFSSPVDMLGVVLAKKCQELNCYKSDLEWLRGIGWVPIGSLEVEKAKRAGEILSDKMYRQHPDTIKFTSIPDSLPMVLAKQNADTMNKRLYTEAWDKDKTQIHIMPDTPEITLARENKKNYSLKQYRQAMEDAKKEGYDLRADAIPIQAAKASREIASDYKYKEGYRKQLGHHIGARNIEDDPKMMWSMHVAKIQSDREYKKAFEKTKTHFSSPVDMLGIAVYKSDLEWLRGIGWLPNDSPVVKRVKNAQELLSDNVYRTPIDSVKYTSVVDSPDVVLAKINAEQISIPKYKEAWEKDKTMIHIMPDTPEINLAKANAVNYSQKQYKGAWDELKTSYDMRADAIPIKTAKASREIASDYKYKLEHEKQKGHYVGVPNAKGDSKIQFALDVAKVQSEREYKKYFAKQKTQCHLPVDMMSIVAAKNGQALVSDADYRHYLHQWICLPDQNDVIHARQAYDLQSDAVYKADLEWLRGIGWLPNDSLGVKHVKYAGDLLSERKYRTKAETVPFTPVADRVDYVTAKNSTEILSDIKYHKDWNEAKTHYTLTDTPQLDMAREAARILNQNLYKESWEKEKATGYLLPPDTVQISHAKHSSDVQSELKYKAEYVKQRGHYVGVPKMRDDPKLVWYEHAGEIQNDRLYKSDYNKTKSKIHMPSDAMAVVAAKECQSLVSDVEYRHYLHQWTCLPDQNNVIHARQAYDLQSDNIYKSDLEWLRGCGWIPLDSVEHKKVKNAQELINKRAYTKEALENFSKYTSVVDTPEIVLAKANSVNQSDLKYKETFNQEKGQYIGSDDTPALHHAKDMALLHSEKHYKKAWEQSKPIGYTLDEKYVPLVGAKHANYINSELKYKEIYEKLKGHYLAGKDIGDFPSVIHSREFQKMRSALAYRKNYEDTKKNVHIPADMMNHVLAKKCQYILSDLEYRTYFHQWSCSPEENDVIHARKAQEILSDAVYKDDLNWLKGLGCYVWDTPQIIQAKKSYDLQSQIKYTSAGKENFQNFSVVTDTPVYVTALQSAANASEVKYKEEFHKTKDKYTTVTETVDSERVQNLKHLYSDNLYKKAWDKVKATSYALPSDSVALARAKELKHNASIVKYREEYDKFKALYTLPRGVEDDPNTERCLRVGKLNIDRLYKEAYEKTKAKVHIVPDMVDIISAKDAQKKVSEIDYRTRLHEWLCLPDLQVNTHVRRVTDQVSDVIYKDDLNWLKGIGCFVWDTPEILHAKQAYDLRSDIKYKSKAEKMKKDFTVVTDTPVYVQNVISALNLSEAVYRGDYKKNVQGKMIPTDKTVDLERAYNANKIQSENLYRWAGVNALPTGYSLPTDTPSFQHAKHVKHIGSDLKYKEAYEHMKAKGYTLGPKDVGFENVRKVNQVINERLYRATYHKNKDKIHTTPDTPEIRQVRATQEAVSDLIYKSDFFKLQGHLISLPYTPHVLHCRYVGDITSDIKYKEDLTWLKGLGCFLYDTPDMVRARELRKLWSNYIYTSTAKKMWPKIKVVLDTPGYRAVQELKTHLSEYLYVELATKERPHHHADGQTQAFTHARNVKDMISEKKYKTQYEKMKDKYTPVPDTPVLIRAKRAYLNASDLRYKETFENTKGKYHTVKDALDIVYHRKVTDDISSVKYKENYMSQLGIWRSIPDRPEHFHHRLVTDAISDVKYKEDLEWLKGTGCYVWDTPSFVLAEKNKVLYSGCKYKENFEKTKSKFQYVADSPSNEHFKYATQLVDEKLYKAAYEKLKARYSVIVDDPRNLLAKWGSTLSSQIQYKKDYEKKKDKYTTVLDTPEYLRTSKVNKQISDIIYKLEYNKAKPKGYTTIQDTPMLLHVRKVKDRISDLKYKEMYERSKSRCNVVADSVHIKTPRHAYKLNSNLDYKKKYEAAKAHWHLIADRPDFVQAAKSSLQQSDYEYKLDREFLKGCKLSVTDDKNTVLALNNAILASDIKYKEKHNKARGTYHVVPDTPQILLAKNVSSLVSENKYKEQSKKQLPHGSFTTLPETRDTVHVKEVTKNVSETNYKKKFVKEKGKSNYSVMLEPPEVKHAMEVAKNQSTIEYKKDAKSKLHYTPIADRPDIKKATQAAKLISNIEYKKRGAAGVGVTMLGRPDIELAKEVSKLTSQVKYKENFAKELGKKPKYDLKEAKIYKTLKDAHNMASEVKYKADLKKLHKPVTDMKESLLMNHVLSTSQLASAYQYKKQYEKSKGHYHVVPDNLEQVHLREASELQSHVKYREKYEKEKGKPMLDFETPTYLTAKESQLMQSEKEYKKDFEESMKGRNLTGLEVTPSLLHVKYATRIASEKEYRKDLEEGVKGKGLTALEETPEMLRAKNATQILNEKEYKKALEMEIRGKGLSELALETPDFVRAKNATDIASQIKYKQLAEMEKANYTSVVDTPEIIHAQQVKNLSSQKKYKEDAEKSMPYYVPVADTPEMQRVRENQKNFSMLQYQSDLQSSKGKVTVVQDTPEILRVKENQKNFSSVKYKESIGKGTPIPDLPEVKRVKETQKHISSVLYKEGLGAGTATPVTPEMERVRRNQEHISSVLYKENVGQATPTPVTPEMERVKRNQEQISSVAYREGLGKATPSPVTPEMERVKRNQEQISSVLYKEHMAKGTPTPLTPEMERAKRNQENISSVLYSDSFRKQVQGKAAYVLDTPEMRRVRETQKHISTVKYHEDFEKSKGSFTPVVTDPITERVKKNMQDFSDISYRGIQRRVVEMERKRVDQDQENLTGQDTWARLLQEGFDLSSATSIPVRCHLEIQVLIQKTFRAMYDYTAADADEVSFKDGDTIVNVQAIDEGWMYGTVQRTGKTGMLPANYVEAV
ncbi:nebulin [Turdus rufiventris]|nr:nebulin [Turdus rufiventris]